MRRYLAFDIETAKPFPENRDWRAIRPLGIACAAAYGQEDPQPRAWYHRTNSGTIEPALNRQQAQSLVKQLIALTDPAQNPQPYTLLTWNGLGFDFDILAEESGMPDECRQLALDHVDMMFHFFSAMGYPLGLDKAAQGMGTPGRPTGMNGALANEMWNIGDRAPVIQYCASDVRSTLALAIEYEKQRRLQWTSNTGRTRFFNLADGWLTVREALEIPEPDRSWMTDPLPQENFTAWLGLCLATQAPPAEITP